MWKVFDELEELGWIGSERPRMVSVQASGCAPIPKAFDEGKEESVFWEGAKTLAAGLRVPHALGDFLILRAARESGGSATLAAGLRVPHALGDFLILRAARESGGSAIAVSDDEIMDGVGDIARNEGLFVCPEGAATFAALKKLVNDGKVDKNEKVVLFNTGSGLKYTELFQVEAPVFNVGEKIDYKKL
jgi:threonine synthase